MSTTISILDSAILGVVEGLTEFLPVSSTGHLKITEGLLDIPVDDPAVVGFSAVIQVGAIAAVLVYFFRDIVRIAGAWGRGPGQQGGPPGAGLHVRVVDHLRDDPDRVGGVCWPRT